MFGMPACANISGVSLRKSLTPQPVVSSPAASKSDSFCIVLLLSSPSLLKEAKGSLGRRGAGRIASDAACGSCGFVFRNLDRAQRARGFRLFEIDHKKTVLEARARAPPGPGAPEG